MLFVVEEPRLKKQNPYAPRNLQDKTPCLRRDPAITTRKIEAEELKLSLTCYWVDSFLGSKPVSPREKRKKQTECLY